jgi:hypothetical protein
MVTYLKLKRIDLKEIKKEVVDIESLYESENDKP